MAEARIKQGKFRVCYQFSFNEYNKVYFSSEEDAAKAIEDLQKKEN